MTETQWLDAQYHLDLCRMADHLAAEGHERKLRLFACACCRSVWAKLSEGPARRAVEVAERFADRAATRAALEDARAAARREPLATLGKPDFLAWCAARENLAAGVQDLIGSYPAAVNSRRKPYYDYLRVIAFVREIFGNPFRLVSVEPGWVTPTVLSLAQAAYERPRLPRGHLARPQLAVLSDALEEAGCDDAELLGHLRSAGPHFRGCWVLDLILDKS